MKMTQTFVFDVFDFNFPAPHRPKLNAAHCASLKDGRGRVQRSEEILSSLSFFSALRKTNRKQANGNHL
jgi:hypothetical protein